MTMETKSIARLDRCVNLAADFGCLRAVEADVTETFDALNKAIDMYMASLSWLPLENRPTREVIVRIMIRNSFLAYRFSLGELTVEDLPDAFAALEISFP